jgi:hypothetical protein
MTPGACSSPSLQQQQPPPPYGMGPKPPTPSSGNKLQKAGMPEKYDKLNKSGSASPHPNLQMLESGGASSSGLQTTPSPQLMNYIEFEGQELTITKQVNLSYKGDNDLLDQKPPQQQQQLPPPNNQNSAILNCLNSNNPPNATATSSPVISGGPPQPNNEDEMKIKNEFVDAFASSNPNNNDLSSPLG